MRTPPIPPNRLNPSKQSTRKQKARKWSRTSPYCGQQLLERIGLLLSERTRWRFRTGRKSQRVSSSVSSEKPSCDPKLQSPRASPSRSFLSRWCQAANARYVTSDSDSGLPCNVMIALVSASVIPFCPRAHPLFGYEEELTGPEIVNVHVTCSHAAPRNCAGGDGVIEAKTT